MTNGLDAIGDSGIAPSPKATRWDASGGRVILDVLIPIAAVVAVVLINGGRPYSNWFFAVVALLVAPRILGASKGEPRNKFPLNPPMEPKAAIRETIFQSVAAGVLYYAFLVTGFGETKQWMAAIFLGVILGSVYYAYARGRKPSPKYMIVTIITGLLLMMIVETLLKRH